ncbi:sigma-70 family RNA polymerase sigma factor [Nocardioides zeae]|uniref:RNA polymerase sigma factor (Sigma-70 family) n=1 Tax=Nocardioides zeae TaxID=1457234 RepID=A0AAJ1U1U9_9ACTN|nr:sigma-70 family RNA polymerase sigma factor [Nocardioides zeae]MDQ1106420.1 RNA polymerase sigma factor (sigma-70 family) [Nocardioides zeae]
MKGQAHGRVEALVAARGRDLSRFAYVLAGHDAEDILQSVVVRLLSSGPFLRADDPYAYARKAVLNEFLDRRRSLGRRASARWFAVRDIEPVPSPEPAIAERDALMRAFSILKPRERACVVMRYYVDADDRTIAEALGVAPSTVRSLISRAMPRLRAALVEAEGLIDLAGEAK